MGFPNLMDTKVIRDEHPTTKYQLDNSTTPVLALIGVHDTDWDNNCVLNRSAVTVS